MIKRKFAYVAIASLLATQTIPCLLETINISYATESNANLTIEEISTLFKNKRENIDYSEYIGIINRHFEDNKTSIDSDAFLITSDLLTKATIETLSTQKINELLETFEEIVLEESTIDTKVRIYANMIKLHRSLGDRKGALAVEKKVESIKGNIVDNYNLALVYYNQAHGDIVDIKMKKETLSNLEKSIKILEKMVSDSAKELLLLSYIDKAQVELYLSKDAAGAVITLEKATEAAKTLKDGYFFVDEYFVNVINELQTHTLPFFFKYQEGIDALKPIIKFYENNGYYSEAYRAQHKLVTMMFDSGMAEALEEGKTLESLLSKIENPSKKKYFEEYSQSLYLANVNAVNGTFDKAIEMLGSKNFEAFEHIYSIDYSVVNMYLGNLNAAVGKTEKSLYHFELMMKAIIENSDDNAFVYTDTTMALAQAYYSLGKYKEGFEVLQKHIIEFVNHDMNTNKRHTEELNKKYEVEMKNAQLLQMELENEKESNKNKMFLVITTGSILLIGVLYVERKKIKDYNKKLSKLSITDSLTGLSNRRSLDEFLGTQSNLLIQLNNTNEEVNISAIMLDIDFFKKYNDNYGHVKGDKVLQKVGNLLETFRSSENDVIARYGGEEFVFILTNTNKQEALNVASKIKTKLLDSAIQHEYSDISNVITVSIGVATKNILKDSLDTLIEDADKALYYSKTHGRNTFTHYDECRSEINNKWRTVLQFSIFY